MIWPKLLSMLAVAVCVRGIAFAATAAEVLKRAEVADRYVSYRGMKLATVQFGRDATRATLKVVHLKPDKTRTEYFAPSLLAGVVMLQDGSEFWRYHPKDKVWEHVGLCGGVSSDDVNRCALSNYEVRMVGTDQIAGRSAYVLIATPRRRGETVRRLWIDREHYLVMGVQAESPDGSVLHSSRYTSVDFNPPDISPSLFKVSGKVKRPPAGSKSAGFKAARPSYLPKGYRLVGVSCLSVNGCVSSHTRFSNGVNTISLFQHRSDAESPATQLRSKVASVITWAREGMRFTLMGDISKAELQKMADSIH